MLANAQQVYALVQCALQKCNVACNFEFAVGKHHYACSDASIFLINSDTKKIKRKIWSSKGSLVCAFQCAPSSSLSLFFSFSFACRKAGSHTQILALLAFMFRMQHAWWTPHTVWQTELLVQKRQQQQKQQGRNGPRDKCANQIKKCNSMCRERERDEQAYEHHV